jgi:hypothetical protein
MESCARDDGRFRRDGVMGELPRSWPSARRGSSDVRIFPLESHDAPAATTAVPLWGKAPTLANRHPIALPSRPNKTSRAVLSVSYVTIQADSTELDRPTGGCRGCATLDVTREVENARSAKDGVARTAW